MTLATSQAPTLMSVVQLQLEVIWEIRPEKITSEALKPKERKQTGVTGFV